MSFASSSSGVQSVAQAFVDSQIHLPQERQLTLGLILSGRITTTLEQWAQV